MDDGKITLDRETFKALAVDSRVKILRILDERQHTLTDLAEELGMAPSTIKEHLDTLVAAGLIKQVDKGMKWKYYRLTSKGKELLNPYEKKVWIVLATSVVALGVTAYAIYDKLRGLGSIKVIRDYMPVPSTFQEKAAQGAHEELLRSAPTMGAGGGGNESIGALLDEDKGAALTATLNDSVNCAGDGCNDLVKAVSSEAERNMTEPYSAVTEAWDSVSTTLADAVRDNVPQSAITSAQTRIVETGIQLPYAEIALFAVCALLAGLCIGYLIKKKSRI